MGKCRLKHKCNDCENLMLDEPIIYIKDNGFMNEKRTFVDGVKCKRRGIYATSIDSLKNSTQLDDMVWLK